ncbi:uncharacterized protein TRAVEDRAFT_43522 [Trametes versicolor FP-101664 SS1]|uniref:uncharacterized protein n=1 Tax=Trametes versicolor (strain FP-101664) TaxID=717944 RepID=UPI000462274A|nr:uncharacterized protein TRAVEDRAFT_43522 [Trametes versicolor FP-101664 SS1]EIW63217.1 hypothetical protein TRAVEDRAFT_43522 [Trametes versicolor FP-101664 SS1]
MPPEFSDIPAAVIYALLDYRRRCTDVVLLDYRRRCTDAVIATLNDMHWMAFGRHSRALSRAPSRNPRTHDSWAWLSCRNPHDRYEKTRVDGHTLIVKVWMKDYLAEVSKTLRSSGPNPAAVLKRAALRQAAQSSALAALLKGMTPKP